MSEETTRKKRVVIAGAGPAGVTCGLEIMRRAPQDFDVVILEETQVIGGISRTVCVEGNRMDIGGHRFFSKDTRIMNWWTDILPLQGADAYDDKKLGWHKNLVAEGPDPEVDDAVMLKRHRVSRIFYDSTFFDYPISLKASTLKAMGFGRTMSVGFSYLGSCIHKVPDTSLENFYVNRFGRKLYSMFFEGYTEKLWGRHPRDISADWGSQRVKGLSIRAVLKDMIAKKKGAKDDAEVETSLIEEFLYPKYGPGQLWEAVAARFCDLGGTVDYGAKVVGVDMDASGTVTGVRVARGEAESVEPCDLFVSSLPLNDLAAAFGDAMPAEPARVAAGLPFRDFVTVGLKVDRLKITNQTDIPTLGNIVPDNWIYVQDDSVKLGRVQIFNNWSPYLVQDVDNTVWVGLEFFCTEGDDFWCMPKDTCIEQARRELVKIGIIDNDAKILLSHRELVKKAYPAYFDTYDEIDVLRDWLKAVPNMYCVGRNGQHRYNNMDHSMLTAVLAAQAVCDGSATQDDIWSVNTEETYHEAGDAEEELAAEAMNENQAVGE